MIISHSFLESLPALNQFNKLFVSEKMIGKDGVLTELGLIPLTDDVRTKARAKVLNNEKLKAEDLKH